MRMGLVGLGRMGLNMARRLVAGGVGIDCHDRSEEAMRAASGAGATPSASLEDLVARLPSPRIVWVMVPSGEPTQQVINRLAGLLSPGDIVVDGGNSHFRDSMRRGAELSARGIGFLDCGTSGGIKGGDEGYCLMIGGSQQTFSTVDPALKVLAQDGGYLLVGPTGSGHYAKMVHNAVEYAMMEAYGEGFELLAARKDFNIDLEATARLWGKGSIVRSWLLELAADALAKDPNLEGIRGYVADTGEGRWAALEALEQGTPVPAILAALTQRHRSRQEESFAAKVVAALRREFGGHEVKNKQS